MLQKQNQYTIMNNLELSEEEVLTISKEFRPKIYCDMDGVLCNFEKGAIEAINRELSSENPKNPELAAKVIKDLSIKRKIHIVILKENVFLFNKESLDITNEALQIFNEKTKSLKIIISSVN